MQAAGRPATGELRPAARPPNTCRWFVVCEQATPGNKGVLPRGPPEFTGTTGIHRSAVPDPPSPRVSLVRGGVPAPQAYLQSYIEP